jgi:NAD(P)-dependent dehydrogenase (short-subunit alcohol dehydrogenase family)
MDSPGQERHVADRKSESGPKRRRTAAPKPPAKRGRGDQPSGSGARSRETAEEYRTLQREAEQKRQRREQSKQQQGGNGGGKQGAMQAGARPHPEPPQPKQHQEKPGLESKLEPRPQYKAPAYRGSAKLQDMVALITGGDSGIGRAVAVLYAREGADVAIIYLADEESDAQETKRAVEAEGRRCLLIPGDVSDSRFCEEAVERVVDEFGKLDVLVNNAAFQEHVSSIEDLSDEQIERTFRTNIFGYFYMARAAVPHLREGCSIVNTGSVTGLEGSKALLDYSATKGAIHTFTMSLAQSLVEKGIRVNCVAPGPVWTPLNPADSGPEKVSKFGSDVPMKRPAQPEELAPMYVFLAAPSCASYISGEVVPVIGGETMI